MGTTGSPDSAWTGGHNRGFLVNGDSNLVWPDSHLDSLDNDLVCLDSHLDSVDNNLVDLDSHLDQVDNNLVDLDSHLDSADNNLVDLDSHLDQGGQQPGRPPGQQQGNQAPTSAPPNRTPDYPSQQLFAVDPGAIRGCMYRFTFIWLSRRQGFWFYPVFVGRTSVAGYRWNNRRRRWEYTGIDLNNIDKFTCF